MKGADDVYDMVLPAYAGMILDRTIDINLANSAPRVCGDDPFDAGVLHGRDMCSPRMRG